MVLRENMQMTGAVAVPRIETLEPGEIQTSKAYRWLYVPQGLTFKNFTLLSHYLVCFVWISEQSENFALHSIKRSVVTTEVESVYSAVGLSPYTGDSVARGPKLLSNAEHRQMQVTGWVQYITGVAVVHAVFHRCRYVYINLQVIISIT